MEVVVGRIGRPHGIKGEVTVEVRTDEPERRLGPGVTVRTDPATAGPLTITAGRVHSGRLLLTFEGVTDRTAAEALRGVLLVADVDPDERPEDPEEFYDHQLVGLAVHTVDGVHVGEIDEVLHLPGQDVLAVRRARARTRGRICWSRSWPPSSRGRPRRWPGRDRPAAGAARRRRRPESSRAGGLTPCASTSSRSSPTTSTRWSSRWSARPAPTGCWTCGSTTCATGRPTGTAPSTTPRTAAEPAW